MEVVRQPAVWGKGGGEWNSNAPIRWNTREASRRATKEQTRKVAIQKRLHLCDHDRLQLAWRRKILRVVGRCIGSGDKVAGGFSPRVSGKEPLPGRWRPKGQLPPGNEPPPCWVSRAGVTKNFVCTLPSFSSFVSYSCARGLRFDCLLRNVSNRSSPDHPFLLFSFSLRRVEVFARRKQFDAFGLNQALSGATTTQKVETRKAMHPASTTDEIPNYPLYSPPACMRCSAADAN